MTTYLIGTDSEQASQVICDHLEQTLGSGATLNVIHVMTSSDIEERRDGETALEIFNDRFERTDVPVSTTQFNREASPTEELLREAEAIDADQIVTALRRHSRTERAIFGSVSHSLIEQTPQPLTLVPLPEYIAD
ncbi:universal stress protein [Haloquadratum walsbyi]|jgi:Universal stress protein UspA and related nucleotide-binding proteins|uniref:Universal stress protein UspA related nucleotide-binding protein n=1 Tax=Haloquadratum walsbyi J07HQW2 TaxID=1238425 RepID=U1NES4_9EURY|nr:universal stress protein [Haloquadratum walsbyi]ERG95268.1 MAG: universal stress protein UspA related nucleotide-binding protein [Haloquadratum walsbyi J07HQW2]